jgi:hypothetical protein
MHADCTPGVVTIGVSLDDTTCGKSSGIAGGICQTTLAGDAAYAKATALPPKQVSCTATVKKGNLPAIPRVPFYTCRPNAQTLAGCDRGLVCLPAARPPEAEPCVPLSAAECPPDYPAALHLTDAVQDSRDCEACECETTDACTNARLEFHDPADPNCSKDAKTTVPADGLCHPTGYTTSWLEYKADVAQSSSCKVTKPTAPTGGVSPVVGTVPSFVRTFCCH